ncbi:hypothetical protein Afil01_03390 [Actinorhabdospora filicis]|uniref:Translation initiation factor 2 n=1 Tax=Actinorhabdospora filicis TaxID=1785913 RepID=A0A9W6W158_9ACTN|nr:hypothetical protein [Actinorhabdospora filicis]GLZ75532.1 hypothetical protein Afil01_03390 [Actinorhabdospora filicis]
MWYPGSGQRAAGSGQRAAGSGRRRAPVAAVSVPADAPDVGRWDTFAAERRVLAVARNVPATTRLMDALSLLRGDRRVEVAFTLTRSTAFHPGDHELMSDLGVHPMPWREAVAERFDLALSASANGPLHELRAPVLLMPHGAGQHKYLDASDPRRGVHGAAPEQLVVDGRVVPTAILVTGEAPLALLRRDCPGAAARALVAGDLSHQQLVAAAPDRDRYRRALGLGPGVRLVTVTSTWGPASLLARHPDLPERLLASLPADEYRVAAVLHPNIAARHGSWQIRHRAVDAIDAGLLLVPPHEGWQAVLTASDCVIGDHGSVGFYAAALDIPLLLAATGDGEVPPDSPSLALAAAAPRFDPGGGVLAQIEDAIAKHRPGVLRGLTGPSLAEVDAARVYRDTMYRLMRLTPPPRERGSRAPAVPRLDRTEPLSHVVTAERTGGAVRLTRFPAATAEYAPAPGRHHAAGEDEPDPRFRRAAAVLAGRDPAALLERYPACEVAVGGGGARTRHGVIRVEDGGGLPDVLLGSALLPGLRSGGPLPEVVLVGGREFRPRLSR